MYLGSTLHPLLEQGGPPFLSPSLLPSTWAARCPGEEVLTASQGRGAALPHRHAWSEAQGPYGTVRGTGASEGHWGPRGTVRGTRGQHH